MQVFTIILLMGLMACERGQTATNVIAPLEDLPMCTAMVAPYLLLILLTHMIGAIFLSKVKRDKEAAPKLIKRMETVLLVGRSAALVVFLVDLFVLHRIVWLEQHLTPMILINDVLAMSPPLIVAIAGWWSVYPLIRQVRIDMNEAVSEDADPPDRPPTPILSRKQFIIMQVRHQLLLMLVPLLALLTWYQSVERMVDAWPGLLEYHSWITFAGAMLIFIIAPLIIQMVWDTEPLPEGPLRDRLLNLCRDYKVRIRRLLLWKTHGGMINAAVMGPIPATRFILLTDGLIDRMSEQDIEAVMAHELGHIKGHHMPLMLLCAMASLVGATQILTITAVGLEQWTGWQLTSNPIDPGLTSLERGFGIGLLVATLLLWATAFGFISRRFERQADTFAVRHLNNRRSEQDAPPDDRFSPEAVDAVCGALRSVAELNHIPIESPRSKKGSRWYSRLSGTIYHWRHGSMGWRIDYLTQLTNLPLTPTRNDRLLKSLCWASLLSIVCIFGFEYLQEAPTPTAPPPTAPKTLTD
jgi:STE24 endopeptidase